MSDTPSSPTLAEIRRWIDALARQADGGLADQAIAALTALNAAACRAVEGWARETLAALPVPLGRSGPDTLSAQRTLLARVAAEAAARDDRPEELLKLQQADWRAGQSAAPYIEHLAALGRDTQAAVVARWALALDGCADRPRIEAALDSISSPPPGWSEAVIALADNPTLEGFEQLMRFTPEDVFYHRLRNTVQMLMRLGVEGNLLFRCATRFGTTPDALELVDRGVVEPETVVQRGQEGPPEARALWLALAARAALAHGDRLGTVRLLAQAFKEADSAAVLSLHLGAIRREADAELHEMLDRAGIPQVPEE